MAERVNKNKFIEDGSYDCDSGAGLRAAVDNPEKCFHRCPLDGQFEIQFEVDYDTSLTEELFWHLCKASSFAAIKTGSHSYTPFEYQTITVGTWILGYTATPSGEHVNAINEGLDNYDDTDHIYGNGLVIYRLGDVSDWGDSTIQMRGKFRVKPEEYSSSCAVSIRKDWISFPDYEGTEIFNEQSIQYETAAFETFITPWSDDIVLTESQLDNLVLYFIRNNLGWVSVFDLELRKSASSSHRLAGFGYSYEGVVDKYPFSWKITRNASNLVQCYYKESGAGSWTLCPQSLTDADVLCLAFEPKNQTNFRITSITLSTYTMSQWVNYVSDVYWNPDYSYGSWTGSGWSPDGDYIELTIEYLPIEWQADFRPTKMKLTFTGGTTPAVTLKDGNLDTVYYNAAYASGTEATLTFPGAYDIYSLIVDGALTLLTKVEFYCEGEAP